MVEESCRIISAAEYARQQETLRQMRETIDSLRMSRRILMSLLEEAQLRLNRETAQLKEEQRRLQQQTVHLSKEVWEKNCRLNLLERQLAEQKQGK